MTPREIQLYSEGYQERGQKDLDRLILAMMPVANRLGNVYNATAGKNSLKPLKWSKMRPDRGHLVDEEEFFETDEEWEEHEREKLLEDGKALFEERGIPLTAEEAMDFADVDVDIDELVELPEAELPEVLDG